MFVGILDRVLVGGIGGDSGGDLLRDQLVDTVRVGPGDVAELIVESVEDVGQLINLGFRLLAASASRDGIDFLVFIRR